MDGRGWWRAAWMVATVLVWEAPSPSPSSNEGPAAQCQLFLSWRGGRWSGRVQRLITVHYSIMVGAYWMLVGDVGWAMGSPWGEVGGAQPAPSAVWGVSQYTCAAGTGGSAGRGGRGVQGGCYFTYTEISHTALG